MILSQIELSVVSPFFNEAEALPKFIDELFLNLDSLGIAYEVIMVNDGSTDNSYEKLKLKKSNNLKIVSLTKNFGHQNALDAGINFAKGSWILTMDSDLQHPPKIIGEMLALAKAKNVDVVYGTQSHRKKDSFFKRFTAIMYYKLIRILTGISLIPHTSDFRLISKRVCDVIKELPEEKIFRLLLPSLGFNSTNYFYAANERVAGKSKYTFWKMLKLAVGSAISFSTTPLRIVSGLGFTAAFIAFLWTLVVFNSFRKGEVIAGWTSMTLIILFLGGLQLIAIGLIGEYLARNLDLAKRRPNYVVDKLEE